MKDWSPEWFDQLYLNNYDRLKSCAYRSLGDRMLADELVQETFLILLSRQQELKKRRHPNIEGWLVITLKNLINNELARANRRNECSLNDENITVTMDQHRSLEDSLPDSLTPAERQVLLWYYEDRLDTQEIAGHLSIPESTVRVRLFRARQKYKKFFVFLKKFETKMASQYIER